MVNILFENVVLKSGEKKTLIFCIDKNKITWDILFGFLRQKTDVDKNYCKLFYLNKYYTCKENSTFHWQNFMNSNDDFIIFKVKYFKNVDYQIRVLKASVSSLSKQGVGVTDLLMEIRELEQM